MERLAVGFTEACQTGYVFLVNSIGDAKGCLLVDSQGGPLHRDLTG